MEPVAYLIGLLALILGLGLGVSAGVVLFGYLILKAASSTTDLPGLYERSAATITNEVAGRPGGLAPATAQEATGATPGRPPMANPAPVAKSRQKPPCAACLAVRTLLARGEKFFRGKRDELPGRSSGSQKSPWN